MRLPQYNKAIVAVFCLATTLTASASPAADLSGHVVVPYQSAKFMPLMDGPTEIAVLSGNPQTGPSSILLRARLKSLCLNAMSCASPGQEPDARHHCPCS